MPVVMKEGIKVTPKKRTSVEFAPATRKIRCERKINKVLQLMDKGYCLYEAMTECDVGAAKRSDYTKIIRKRLKCEQSALVDNLRISAERKLSYIYRQFINEFEASTKNSKGERVPGNPEYLYGAQSLIQDIVKLHGLALEVQPNQTNVAFNWQSLQQLAQGPSQTVELQPESITSDPIEDQIKQLESKAITDESSIDSAHITIQDTSDSMNGKKRVVLVNGKNGHTSNGMNGHGSGKQYHPEE